MKNWLAVAVIGLLIGANAFAQVEADIRNGDSIVSVVTMGEGDHVVISLHGYGRNRQFFFTDPAGAKLGQELAKAGFRVIAPSWSGQLGSGFSELGAAIAHAKATGARKISLMGHSRGGGLAASFARQQPDGSFDTVIQLASVDDQALTMTKTKKLFAFNKHDKWPAFQAAAFEKSAEPKQIIELGGSGHGVNALIAEKPDFVQDVLMVLKR